jgi:DNA-binding MarR family transcriptional regulator
MVDPTPTNVLHEAMELLFFGYRAFTEGPDRILEPRGLGRVHHRILYFVGRNPGVPVKGLLEILGVSKQAINLPLRQLMEMDLVVPLAAPEDRRIKRLELTAEGRGLEAELTGAQTRQLAAAFQAAGPEAAAGWRAVMTTLAAGSPAA